MRTSVQSEIQLDFLVKQLVTNPGPVSKFIPDVKTLKSAVKDVVQAEDRGKT